MSAAALIGIDVIAGSAAGSTTSTVTVTQVTATTTASSTGTAVRTTLKIKNTAAVRKPASSAWLYLSAGTKKYTLGRVAVKALAAGSSTSVTAVRGTPSRATAGKYSVLACVGAYSAKQCRTSTATVSSTSTKRARPETGVMLDVARA